MSMEGPTCTERPAYLPDKKNEPVLSEERTGFQQSLEFIEKEDMRYLLYVGDPDNVPLSFINSALIVCHALLSNQPRNITKIL